MSFCSLTKGITPKICWFCLALINSVLCNLFCVWMTYTEYAFDLLAQSFRDRLSSIAGFRCKEGLRCIVCRSMTSISIPLLLPQVTAPPQQLPSGQWNCSVPEWPQFQPHFACDLMPECVGGEDEVDCPYTGHCGQGQLSAAGRCVAGLPCRLGHAIHCICEVP